MKLGVALQRRTILCVSTDSPPTPFPPWHEPPPRGRADAAHPENPYNRDKETHEQDVTAWLAANGLEQYWTNFDKFGFDTLAVLPTITVADIDAMQVRSFLGGREGARERWSIVDFYCFRSCGRSFSFCSVSLPPCPPSLPFF